MMQIQNKHVDWQRRWIRILKENSKTEVARVIPFEPGSRLEQLLRRRAFLGRDAYVLAMQRLATTSGAFDPRGKRYSCSRTTSNRLGALVDSG